MLKASSFTVICAYVDHVTSPEDFRDAIQGLVDEHAVIVELDFVPVHKCAQLVLRNSNRRRYARTAPTHRRRRIRCVKGRLDSWEPAMAQPSASRLSTVSVAVHAATCQSWKRMAITCLNRSSTGRGC